MIAQARRWGPLAAVLAASVAFRLPALLHPSETNSDAAVVGLQAMHLLRGEWSWFLWGSGYQSSVDSAFAALLFGLLGPSPLALVASSFVLHLVLTALAWSTLARRLGAPLSSLAVLPLVLTSSPLQTYILYPPRQAALTIAVAAVWALDRAAVLRRARAFAAGGALLALACFADPYALVLVPPIAAFGLACAFDVKARRVNVPCTTALAAGGALGALPLLALRASRDATQGQLALTTDVVAHNARLLWDPCLAWTSGARAWSASTAVGYAPWEGPLLVRAACLAGGTLFLAAVVAGGLSIFRRSTPWEVRRLAVAGALALPVTVAGFLVSPMVMDLFSSRYLAAIPLLAPFALAPVAYALGSRRFAALVAPCVFASGVAGWDGYGPFFRTDGGVDEAKLEALLASRGIRYASADYWAAYRLTFLANERIIVVPDNAREDRYPPYRAAYEAAGRNVAVVFDPVRSRGEAPEPAAGTEAVRAGRFTAIVPARP